MECQTLEQGEDHGDGQMSPTSMSTVLLSPCSLSVSISVNTTAAFSQVPIFPSEPFSTVSHHQSSLRRSRG